MLFKTPIGKSPDICRLVVDVFKAIASLSRYAEKWGLELMLHWLKLLEILSLISDLKGCDPTGTNNE